MILDLDDINNLLNTGMQKTHPFFVITFAAQINYHAVIL